MKKTMFGANGQIGQLLVKQALQAGYDVAKCMLDATMKDEWIHKMPIVFNN